MPRLRQNHVHTKCLNVTYVDQVTQLKVTRQAGSLSRNTLHETAITGEDCKVISTRGDIELGVQHTISVVVDQVEALLVVQGSHVSLGDTEADRVREALAKRTGGDLDAIRVSSLGVTRGQRAELTEVLEVVERKLEAEQVEEDVLEGATTKRPKSPF